MTGAELDKIVASLRTVGGAYLLVAAAVERDNRGQVERSNG